MAQSEFDRRRRARNLWIALALAGFVLLMFAVSVVKMQGVAG